MKRNLAIVATAILFCTTGWSVNAADLKQQIVGTWRVTSYTNVTVETSEIARPFGENPIGYLQYSPGGHMVTFLQAGNPPKPASFPLTDAERAAIHSRIFGAYAGTYSVEGNTVTHHILAAWRPDYIGGDQVRNIELNGNKLTIRTAPLISPTTGKRIVATLTFEREE